jgi:putative ABC transport system substrate-binding protein
MLLLAAPLAVEAKPAKMLPRVAVLYPGSPVQHNELAAAFVQGMRDNDYVDGKDFALDVRYVGTRLHELDRIITELLPLRPDVIVTVGSQGAWAAKRATSTIPIVMAVVADPSDRGSLRACRGPEGTLPATPSLPKW